MKIKSLCPECLGVIDAEIEEKNNKIIIKKTCKEHGGFEDLYYGDAKIFNRFLKDKYDNSGLENPNTHKKKGCPYDCGLCNNHKSPTVLGIIDVTNRCNQKCPVCFANAEACGYVYEPTIKQLKKMLHNLINEKPVPCRAVMFSGGEPTMRKDLPYIIRMAKQMGFIKIFIATNGINISKDPNYIAVLKEAGLDVVYLQFDGITEKPYHTIRGFNALPIKLKVIENCRKINFNQVILVPTLIGGVNDKEVGEIVKFAVKNSDVVVTVNFQPLSFAGRVDEKDLKKMRITQSDLMHLLEEQLKGQIGPDDFYSVPSLIPLSLFFERLQNKQITKFSCHPACGSATYIYIDDRKIIPITRFVDIDSFFNLIKQINNDKEKNRYVWKIKAMSKIIKEIPKLVDKTKMPKSINMIKLAINFLKGDENALAVFYEKSILIGAMHFMDGYNFDCQRVQRCVVHYSTLDDRIIPFCSYNAIHRTIVEKKFSKPLNIKSKNKEDRNFK
ncbi:MAG: radical SAM protein [Candidatus Aenigmarchaeota archaeon]|nr:radical SAM protein [Candidatus Aenigmarchaeota archaeon]